MYIPHFCSLCQNRVCEKELGDPIEVLWERSLSKMREFVRGSQPCQTSLFEEPISNFLKDLEVQGVRLIL